MLDVIIRRLKPEDTDDIDRIYTAITKTPVRADFRKITEEHALKQENASFVAEIDGKVVGYIISYTLSSGFGVEKSAWIPSVGVDPKCMGQGIGKRMAEELFEFYKKTGIKDVHTSVRWDSTDLLSFFKTLDFYRSDFINLRKTLG
ncbi:MAG: GNAT family N-acetyltransferase [Desulfobacterales bacterium]|nr:GNAT family N-acetyltransferase [Desulfobacterales bacterium]